MALAYEGVIKVVGEKNSRKQSAKKNTGVCNRCGRLKGNTRLYVHHKDRNPINNDPDNLETLCGSCHKKEHTPESRPCLYCDRPARHKGMCGLHWQRFRKHGNPNTIVVWKDGKRVKIEAVS